MSLGSRSTLFRPQHVGGPFLFKNSRHALCVGSESDGEAPIQIYKRAVPFHRCSFV